MPAQTGVHVPALEKALGEAEGGLVWWWWLIGDWFWMKQTHFWWFLVIDWLSDLVFFGGFFASPESFVLTRFWTCFLVGKWIRLSKCCSVSGDPKLLALQSALTSAHVRHWYPSKVYVMFCFTKLDWFLEYWAIQCSQWFHPASGHGELRSEAKAWAATSMHWVG